MITEIWINGKSWDLYSDTKIRHTLQANDIAEVKDRQASFTNSFSCPKTANNIRIAKGLGIAGDTSRIPYEKPNCQMKIDGFDLIVKGWANITETMDEYKIYVYSGIINFFKAIENISLGELGLSELNHRKELSSVISSFGNPVYKYLITDFNGLTHYGTNNEIINIDYLIPFVNAKYLWDKIHSTFQFEYLGETFAKDDFTNLWVSYPKPIAVDNVDTIINHRKQDRNVTVSGNSPTYWRSIYFIGEPQLESGTTFTAPETAQYRIVLKINNSFVNGGISGGYPVKYYMGLNEDGIPFEQQNSQLLLTVASVDGAYEINKVIPLNQGDKIYFYDFFEMNGGFWWNTNFELTIEKILPGEANFSEELKDLAITDFIKEILNQFALSVFYDEFYGKIEYLTLEERLALPPKDWSDKYISRKSESYVYDSYAKNNMFTYKYDDKESTFHDGSLSIDNLNLPDKKPVFSSKMYSPEKNLSAFYLGSAGVQYLRMFKMYNKDVQEKNGAVEIKYKGLDKRFHFARMRNVQTSVQVGSKTFDEQQAVSNLPTALFTRLDWNNLLRKNYPEFGRILNDSRIHNVELDLDIVDLLTVDLQPMYFFAHESQYYFLNKLSFDERNAIGEFVRVKKISDVVDVEDPTVETIIKIIWMDGTNSPRSGTDQTVQMQIQLIQNPADDEIISLEWQKFSNGNWQNMGTGNSPYTANTSSGVQKFRLKAISESTAVHYSNELQFTKVGYRCIQYYVWDYVNSGDDLSIDFIDCNGIQQNVTQSAPDGTIGYFLSVTVCAVEDSVNINRGTLEDQGICGGYECHKYSIAKSAAYVGDSMNFSYTSCEGIYIETTVTADYPGQQLEEVFCARVDTVISDSGYVDLGPCD